MRLTTKKMHGAVPLGLVVSAAIMLAACGGGSDLTSVVASPAPAATTPAAPGAANSPPAVCGLANSAKVGQVAVLKTIAHRVSGTAKVIDNCTIELTAFNYDGQGLPDVFVYGGKGGNYSAGFAIGSNLFGTAQTNATLRVTLKDGQLDNLDGVSIWCVRAGVSFGDGLFAKVP